MQAIVGKRNCKFKCKIETEDGKEGAFGMLRLLSASHQW